MKPRPIDPVLGLGYLLLTAAVLVGAILVYNKTFESKTTVNLQAGPVGNALQKGSDVKLHGVPVGRVAQVKSQGSDAVVTLDLKPGTTDLLPVNTSARLLPKTLFGERFVSLVVPEEGGGPTLKGGDTIQQDTSGEAAELEEIFDELLPLLQSIQPDKLSATLGELAATLRGRGGDLGDSVETLGKYLSKLNPKVPTLTDDLAKLGSVANTYADAAPDLLSALDTLTTTSATLVDQQTNLRDVYASVITAADSTGAWVGQNRQTIEVLADESRAALEAIRPYATQFPCLLNSARKFIPVMDKTLGKDTDEEGMHLRLNIVKARGKYVPGKDDVKYSSGKMPRCPYVTGQTGTKPVSASGSAASADQPETIAPPRTSLPAELRASTGLGDANSPAENQLVAELVAPTVGVDPQDYPEWGSLLVGPVLRGQKVVLK